MRIMIDISDTIYRRLKSGAASVGSSVKELILRGVRPVLKESARKRRKRIKLPIVRSKRPGTLAFDNQKIFEMIRFPDLPLLKA